MIFLLYHFKRFIFNIYVDDTFSSSVSTEYLRWLMII